jgi:hypothetical protein
MGPRTKGRRDGWLECERLFLSIREVINGIKS